MCIYKTSLPHRPDNFIDFTSSCPPHFTTKLRPCGVVMSTLIFYSKPEVAKVKDKKIFCFIYF